MICHTEGFSPKYLKISIKIEILRFVPNLSMTSFFVIASECNERGNLKFPPSLARGRLRGWVFFSDLPSEKAIKDIDCHEFDKSNSRNDEK